MYKLLVVDDEINIRKGIINAVQWDALGLELAGEAGDGNEAIAKLRDTVPDIVLMDMRMPGMDGIGLIHAMKKQYPMIRFIIISAYSDFDYTREAIINRAFDYLLKPIKKDELNRVLSSCIQELNRDKALSNNSIQSANTMDKLISELILDTLNNEEAEKKSIEWINSRFDFPRVRICVFKIDNIIQAKKQSGQNDIFSDMKGCIEHFFEKPEDSVVFLNRPDHEIVAVLNSNVKGTRIDHFLADVLRQLQKQMGFTISAGIGGEARTPGDLHSSYKQAKRALSMKKILSSGEVILFHAGQDDRIADSEKMLYKGDLILNTIKTGNTDKSLELLSIVLSDMVAGNLTVHSIQKNLIILLGDIDKELYNNGTSIEIECGRTSMQIVNDIISAYSIDEMMDIFRIVVSKPSLFYQMKNKKGGKKIVDEILKSIQNDYSRPISLYAYAKQYYLNPDYLGRVFKNETGKSFADYLTEVRIKKAMELIQNGMCSHYYEVASNVGYDDYSYFCKVFKAFAGQTPGEYKESLKSKNKM